LGILIILFYGSSVLAFQDQIKRFHCRKIPRNRESYSAFESKVTVQDKEPFDARIYMNNVGSWWLSFFQSSFDPDEKGTVLSVNHDFWEQG
jgi:hypothetical protein